jgi:D-alanyl-D-alanine carboxypeptidase
MRFRKIMSLVPGAFLIIMAVSCGENSVVTPDNGHEADITDVDGVIADTLVEDGVVADISDVEPTDTTEVVVPEFNAVLADSLGKLLQEQVSFSPDPGVTLTVRTADGAWWTGAAGFAKITDAVPMAPDSAFRVGSNTKPIVAATILQLVEEGSIGLDEPLTTYLPEYTEWSAITVRMLLNMRSGLQDFIAIPECVSYIIFNPAEVMTPAAVIEYVRNVDLLFEPDTNGKYTNTSYVLLGMIIEQVTGNTAESEIRTRIIEPLGLTNTYLDEGTTVNDMLANGYIDFGLAGTALGVKPAIAAMIPAPYENGLMVGTNLIHPSVLWTSGALVSTSKDMATLVYSIMTGKLFSQALVDEMATTQDAQLFSGLVPYGLGLQVRDTIDAGKAYGHGGLNFGYQAGTYYLPDSGITYSHMHNFLIDAYDTFQEDIIAMILAGGDADYEPCVVPDGLFRTGDDGKYFNMAFKGMVNAADAKPAKVGTGSFRMANASEIKPVSGIFPNAVLGNSAGVDNVTVTGYGLSDKDGIDLVITSVILGVGLLDGLSEDGRKLIVQANLGDSFVTVSDASYVEGTDTIERICIVGISDYTRTGESFLCKGSRDIPVAGGTVKVMSSLPYNDNLEYVTAVVGALGIPRCGCLVGTAYEPCE